ncbi:MAG: hypothetical protein QW376_07695 [Candidatus Caldarchaeum sp.]
MENPFQVEEEKPAAPKVETPPTLQMPQAQPPAEAPQAAQLQPEIEPLPKKEDFWAWFDAQIEQAHDELNVFQAGAHDQVVPEAPRPEVAEVPEQPAQSESSMWKYLLIAAGGLLALALAAPLIRKLLGRQDDDSDWYRRGSSVPKPPVKGSGSAVTEPSENSYDTAKPRAQDIAAMALGKW